MNDEPLILLFESVLMAVEPDTGSRRWERRIDYQPERLFRTGNTLVVANDQTVQAFSITTGDFIGQVQLPFRVRNGLQKDGRLYLSGRGGAACLDADGTVLWCIAQEFLPTGLLQGKRLTTGYGRSREVRWQTEDIAHMDAPCGLLLGDAVVQPDLIGHR